MNYPSLKISTLALAIMLAACSTDPRNEQESEIDTQVDSPAKAKPVASVEMHAQIIKENKPMDVARKRVGPAQEALMSTGYAVSMAMPAPLHDQIFPQQVNRQDRENYLSQNENPIKRVSETPVSTFSVDVDTAAYSNVRRMMMREGRLPPSDAVKAEEFVNYFDYQYTQSDNLSEPFTVQTEVAPSPWNANTHLVQIGLKGFEPELSERPASNLVFLVDVSGSMQSPYK